MAAQQLRDLTRNVAADVSDHNAVVCDFTSQLDGARKSGDNQQLAQAIDAMVAANEKLQGRLSRGREEDPGPGRGIADPGDRSAHRRPDQAGKSTRLRQRDERQRRQILQRTTPLFDAASRRRPLQTFQRHPRPPGGRRGAPRRRPHPHQDRQDIRPCVPLWRRGIRRDHAQYGDRRLPAIAAERVRTAIEAMEVQFEGKQLKVTASVGLAEIGAGEDGVKLVRRADDAVYASKEAGRNCGHWHDGVDCLPVKGERRQDGTVPPINRRTNKRLRRFPAGPVRARTCPTGGVRRRIARRISESHRFGISLCVMHLRVKDYARLENTYGQAVGQLLLDSVATFIRSTLRDMDLLGKYDRDEFVVMLPGSSENEAKQVGRRVKTAISQLLDSARQGEGFARTAPGGLPRSARRRRLPSDGCARGLLAAAAELDSAIAAG